MFVYMSSPCASPVGCEWPEGWVCSFGPRCGADTSARTLWGCVTHWLCTVTHFELVCEITIFAKLYVGKILLKMHKKERQMANQHEKCSNLWVSEKYKLKKHWVFFFLIYQIGKFKTVLHSVWEDEHLLGECLAICMSIYIIYLKNVHIFYLSNPISKTLF